MITEEFEVTEEVYERAKANRGYMTDEDILTHFSNSILCGYGLYNCQVYERDGKYICSYWRGASCD